MTICLFDTKDNRDALYPLSLTRPICDIRFGILTIREWYSIVSGLGTQVISHFESQDPSSGDGDYLCIDTGLIPTLEFWQCCQQLEMDEGLKDDKGWLAFRSNLLPAYGKTPTGIQLKGILSNAHRIVHPMDLVKRNAAKINDDITLMNPEIAIVSGSDSNLVFGKNLVYAEPGANVQGVKFNTIEGPVYIGKGSLVMEGALVRGPAAICESGVVKMGAQIYPGTTIGKGAVAGGEIKNSILGDFSNKAHHGYLGDSIIGQWCNLGAGTSNSNVKNNASVVKMWSEQTKSWLEIGRKAGMLMGDYSKTAINTQVNTGATIGICCSIHLSAQSKHVPSFSWGPGEQYHPDKAIRDILNWYELKRIPPEQDLSELINRIFLAINPV